MLVPSDRFICIGAAYRKLFNILEFVYRKNAAVINLKTVIQRKKYHSVKQLLQTQYHHQLQVMISRNLA